MTQEARVELSQDLYEAAISSAMQANRTLSEQLQYWADIGRSVENIVASRKPSPRPYRMTSGDLDDFMASLSEPSVGERLALADIGRQLVRQGWTNRERS